MKMLAIDTTSDACTLAVQRDDHVFEQHHVEARIHTRILVPAVTRLLAEADLKLSDLDTIVLGNGPGSFIGLRIAASLVQGLAYASGLKILPVSSLAVIAAQVMATEGAERVVVAQDARMGEAYLGCFIRGADGLPEPLAPERLQGKHAISELEGIGWVAAGAGWRLLPDLVTANTAVLERVSEIEHPHARYLLQLGMRDWKLGRAIEPHLLEPAYLRHKVAETPK